MASADPIKSLGTGNTSFLVEGKEACRKHMDDIKVTSLLQGSMFPAIDQNEAASQTSDKEFG